MTLVTAAIPSAAWSHPWARHCRRASAMGSTGSGRWFAIDGALLSARHEECSERRGSAAHTCAPNRLVVVGSVAKPANATDPDVRSGHTADSEFVQRARLGVSEHPQTLDLL